MLEKAKEARCIFKGKKLLCISDYEKCLCSFYEIELNSIEERYTIVHSNYFIEEMHKRYQKPITLCGRDEGVKYTLVVFEEQCSGCREVALEEVDTFLYHLTRMYVEHEDFESAMVVCAQTQDLYMYLQIKNCKSIEGKKEVLQQLAEVLDQPSRRHSVASVKIQVSEVQQELCVLELLERVVHSPGAKLLWNYNSDYAYIGIKNKIVDDKYHFIKPKYGYGEVVGITIGSEKLNIGIKVNVEGLVEEYDTGIKVAANIKREYAIVVDGKLNRTQLWCQLTKALYTEFKKKKLIKGNKSYRQEEIYELYIEAIPIVNKRVQKAMSQVEIVKELYEIETLKCKERVIKQLLKQTSQYVVEGGTVDPIYERFQINRYRTFIPSKRSQQHQFPYKVYTAKIILWKIDKFPKKRIEELIQAEYALIDSAVLTEQLKCIEKERKAKSYKVNQVRMAYGLLETPLGLWEHEGTKEKTRTDKVLGINSVVNDEVRYATKVIEGITFKQECFQVIIRCNDEVDGEVE